MSGQLTSHDHGAICYCSKNHQPAPLELNRHHILPLENGGPNTADNVVWNCPTTHVNVHEILRLLIKFQEPEGTLTYWTVNAMYEQPLNRYAYDVAFEGARRINGLPWRPIARPTWADPAPVGIPGQLEIDTR